MSITPKVPSVLIIFCILFISAHTFAQVGINTTTPNPSSMLDVSSTESGVLIPRMTEAQRDAITTPAESLLIFQTDNDPGFYFFDGTVWKPINDADDDWRVVGADMYSNNTGNVGIGTTTPDAVFHVKGTAVTNDVINQTFEAGIAPFTTTGAATWATQGSIFNTGNFAAQAGAITDNQTSTLEHTVTVPAGGETLSFAYQVSSEATFDFLRFYVDGTQIAEWSGSTAWSTYSTFLTAGAHTLTWAYEKDGSTARGDDTARLDDILLRQIIQPVFKLADGTQGANKVLTSDADGNTSWGTVSASSITNIPDNVILGKQFIIPSCNDNAVGATGSFNTTINGKNHNVTWRVDERQTNVGQTENVIRSISVDFNAESISVVKRRVLKADYKPEKLRVEYEFSPPLSFVPDALFFTTDSPLDPDLPDSFNITYTDVTDSSMILNIIRVDNFSNETADCWTGLFTFDMLMIKE